MKKSKDQTSIQKPRSASQGSGRAGSFFFFPPPSLKEAKGHPLLSMHHLFSGSLYFKLTTWISS